MEHAGLAHTLGARVFLLVAAAGLGLSKAYAADCATSVYSPVSEQDCRPLPALEIDRRIVSGKGGFVFECFGAPEGFRLYLIESDPRSWYVIEHRGERHSLERMIFDDGARGNFPNVGQGGKVEWVLADGAVKGMIFRVSYQEIDGTDGFSELFSISLENRVPKLKGVSKGNEEARQRLDYCPRD